MREREHFWRSRPSRWLLLSSVLDIVLVGLFATQGILMTAVRPEILFGLVLSVLVYLTLVDFAKVRIFRRFALR